MFECPRSGIDAAMKRQGDSATPDTRLPRGLDTCNKDRRFCLILRREAPGSRESFCHYSEPSESGCLEEAKAASSQEMLDVGKFLPIRATLCALTSNASTFFLFRIIVSPSARDSVWPRSFGLL